MKNILLAWISGIATSTVIIKIADILDENGFQGSSTRLRSVKVSEAPAKSASYNF